MRTQRFSRVRQGFTLIEILIVVVILGILAAIVIPQFTDASQEAAEANLRSQLQTIRSQIELYNVQNPGSPFDDQVAAAGDETFWDPLLQGNYLQSYPLNPLTPTPAVNDPRAVHPGVGPGNAWVWFESSAGDTWTLNVYACDAAGVLFSDPDTGNAY